MSSSSIVLVCFHLRGVNGSFRSNHKSSFFNLFNMIIFNTLKKAQHYINFKNNVYKRATDPYDTENYSYYTISSNKVLYVTGFQCGCGCDNRWISNTVIGRVKSLK